MIGRPDYMRSREWDERAFVKATLKRRPRDVARESRIARLVRAAAPCYGLRSPGAGTNCAGGSALGNTSIGARNRPIKAAVAAKLASAFETAKTDKDPEHVYRSLSKDDDTEGR